GGGSPADAAPVPASRPGGLLTAAALVFLLLTVWAVARWLPGLPAAPAAPDAPLPPAPSDPFAGLVQPVPDAVWTLATTLPGPPPMRRSPYGPGPPASGSPAGWPPFTRRARCRSGASIFPPPSPAKPPGSTT